MAMATSKNFIGACMPSVFSEIVIYTLLGMGGGNVRQRKRPGDYPGGMSVYPLDYTTEPNAGYN